MPHGTSGGFPIETAGLKRLVVDVAAAPTLCLAGGSSTSELRLAGGAEVLRLVEECSHERVAVEAQGHSAYIIRLGNEPMLWVCVCSDSPMFAWLKQRHDQWKVEHPNWWQLDWIQT